MKNNAFKMTGQFTAKRRMLQISVILFGAYLSIFAWIAFQAHQSFLRMSLVESSQNDDLQQILRSAMSSAQDWTVIIAILSFLGGVAVTSLYQTIRFYRKMNK